MRKILKIVISSVMVALTACFLELLWCYIVDDMLVTNWRNKNSLTESISLLSFFAAPCTIVLISLIALFICKIFKFIDRLQTKIMLMCADGLYIILMLTLFQIGSYYLQIGAGYGEGLYFAFIWFLSLGVSGITLLILIALVVGEKINKRSEN